MSRQKRVEMLDRILDYLGCHLTDAGAVKRQTELIVTDPQGVELVRQFMASLQQAGVARLDDHAAVVKGMKRSAVRKRAEAVVTHIRKQGGDSTSPSAEGEPWA